MGVTGFGRGNKVIAYRALGVGMKIAFFRGWEEDGRPRILPRTGISSAIYVVSRFTSLTSPLLSAFGADRDKGVAVSASARSSEVRSYSLPIPHI